MSNKILMATLCFLFSQVVLVAQVTVTGGITVQQGCDVYLKAYSKGTMYEQSSYDKKGKLTGVSECLVVDLKSDSTGWTMSLLVKNKDKKDKEITQSSAKCSCKDGVIVADMANLMSNAIPPDMKFEGSMNGNAPSYSNLEVGKPQADSEMEMSVNMEGIRLMKVTVKSTQRQVVAKETITTSAGTFECFKITSYHETKFLFTGKQNVTEYWNNDYGMVKMEMYDMKGKPNGYMELSKFKK